AGAGLSAILPQALSWKSVLLLSCIPQAIALALLPMVVRQLPSRLDRAGITTATPGAPLARRANLVPLAFAAGAAVAIAYSSVEQLAIPVRGSREFGLDRAGIAQLFMLMQGCDVVALIPIGLLADRIGAVKVLAGITLA